MLSERANANGVAWPGQGRIAADAGCDYTTAAHALKRLEAQRLITHTGWHDSPRGPIKEFTLDLQRILALGAVGEAPTVGITPSVGAEGTVGGTPEKPFISHIPHVSHIRPTQEQIRVTTEQIHATQDKSDEVMSSIDQLKQLKIEIIRPDQTDRRHQLQPSLSVSNELQPSLPVSIELDRTSPFSRENDPAGWLANYLWMYLSVRPEVEIPYSWETYWSLDFQDALDRGWELEQLEAIVQASQYGAARQYYVRAKSICDDENLKRLEKIAEYLGKKDLLEHVICRKCNAYFSDIALMVDHFFVAHPLPVDPEDVAEEEAMWPQRSPKTGQ